ncbi:MAG: hypothetical protein A2928_03195 [Candidatus Taylorbacteria bacterium RIFCSPLOWO2_01_FULL_45_15b]|uniref:Aspartokinase n=1 Tax=Candidatus Taylorbacteria bacterium RIFCSPLOWO2_01_FULL_45_15b TaxID=1802319 RepID=A0A1G2NDR3_9BACT|nr:MAG: hypothetical protein A2928_03195 [Candidatus Taylorbacteria bacterium RIFCSPLOWO2_01_FULL_45_15b]
MIVCKFGGTSLADIEQIKKVAAIVRGNPERKFIVVSAPGKRSSEDKKITDLLLIASNQDKKLEDRLEALRVFGSRFSDIVAGLDVPVDVPHFVSEIERMIEKMAYADAIVSRGEYLMAKILAAHLDFPFVDAVSFVRFDEHGRYSETRTALEAFNKIRFFDRAVIPGFYGADGRGVIHTFPRGGSDLTGAIVAQFVEAKLYENWTDANGVYAVDPRIIADAPTIQRLSYKELRELTYSGATVFHEEAMFPVMKAGIPIHVRNTHEPENIGTLVSPSENVADADDSHPVTGIAGRKDFLVLAIEKMQMNSEVGYVRRIASVLERHRISFEHMPSGIDSVSIIIEVAKIRTDGRKVGELVAHLVKDLQEDCNPDSIQTFENIALVSTVGKAMRSTPGIAARLFGALARERINVRLIIQGSSEISIIIGVLNSDYEAAIRAIYKEFFS